MAIAQLQTSVLAMLDTQNTIKIQIYVFQFVKAAVLMATALVLISAVAFKVTAKITQSLTSALQCVILDVGILIVLLQIRVLVSVVIQNKTKTQIIVFHFVLLVAFMESARNLTNALVMLVL
jgi:hypothetical protein